MRHDDLIGNPGDLSPADEAERAEARRHKTSRRPHGAEDAAGRTGDGGENPVGRDGRPGSPAPQGEGRTS